MRPAEFASVFSLPKPRLPNAGDRVARALTISDLRLAARRALPRVVFDYLDSGAEDELCLQRNRQGFEELEMVPEVLNDVRDISTTTTILGCKSSLPLILAPTGFTQLIHHQGERAVARAAAAGGIPYAVATLANTPLEEVAQSATGPKAFQLFMLRDRGISAELVERAGAAGFDAMILTVDSQLPGIRERDVRNGLSIPPTVRPRTALEGLIRPSWSLGFLRNPQLTFANLAFVADPSSLMEYVSREFDMGLSWEAVAWLRERWKGPLGIKGILSPEDAKRARDHGVDALIVSNHGGRQLSAAPAAIDALPAVVDAVGPEVEVILDSGVRRGADIAKAVALGARACMIGRPYLYGLAAGGQQGAERAIQIFRDELVRNMALLGTSEVATLSERTIRVRGQRAPISA